MKEIIHKFYTAFGQLDADTMAACYHDDIHFEDPAFGILKGEKVKNMWRMLCESQKGKDFRIEFSDIKINQENGSAHWEAHYNFSKTGRKVHNKIDASFKFKDEKIIRHIDSFNLHKWASQAMGTTGTLIGWTPFFKKKMNTQSIALLNNFENK